MKAKVTDRMESMMELLGKERKKYGLNSFVKMQSYLDGCHHECPSL